MDTNYKITLSNVLKKVSRSWEKRSAYHTIVKSPLDNFHGWKTEDDLKDESDKEGVFDDIDTDIIIKSKYSGISEIYSKTYGIRESW